MSNSSCWSQRISVQGFNCERCQAGYYGDAVNSQCSECSCNLLGTDPER